MKVLAFTPQFLPVVGGIEIFSNALAQCLKQQAVETTVVTAFDRHGLLPEHEVLNGIPVYRLGFSQALRARESATSLHVLHQLGGIVSEAKPDVIHMHSAVQASAWFVDRLTGKLSPRLPFVVTQHGMLEPADRIGVARTLMLKADALTAVSRAVLQSVIEFSGRTLDATVIYNGIPAFDPAPRTGMAQSPYRLTCIGRLEDEKGFDLALEALPAIRAAGLDASLTIVGQGQARKRLDALVRTLGLEPHVRFTGVLDRRDTQDAIARSTLVLIPSRTHEGFSLVAAEAALAGVPCVAARLGGLTETIEDGVSGVLVPPNDRKSLATAVTALLRDAPRWQALGDAAQRIGKEKFSMDRCVAGYLGVYRSLVR